ncbi:MAG TPA: cytochrome C oxidase subunit IV family protein [Casimicrobiaceae bacterium]|nr:cytochrome C oxidase subunit IV family protein [Casimicrobiaceae bacterium]
MITHPVPAVRTYVLVWAGLMTLLLLTLGSAFLPLGWGNAAINLVIAVAKSLLVVFFFMHLRSAHYVLRIAATAGFFWLAILLALSLTDFAVRY